MARSKTPPEERLWKFVVGRDPEKCWLWNGAKIHGYGVLKLPDGTHVKAHRLSFTIAKGPIPDRTQVCHHCDNPSCVNPAHLFLGDQQANMQDKVAKGRANVPHGENNFCAKLTNAAVTFIRETDMKAERLAAIFAVSVDHIKSIRARRSRRMG